MASAMKDKKDMATEEEDSAPAGPRSEKTSPVSRGGFFTIQKYGQGKWTRLGTTGGILFLATLTGYQTYATSYSQFKAPYKVAAGIGASLFGLICLLGWWYMNKASSADFLIATDSEMKKVNWTSRKELIGSTKVVVIFMFLIAFMLFGVDIFFSYFFYFIGVLKSKPF